VFSRAEQRVLQAIFKAIAEDGGRCVATLAMLAHDSNTSKSTARNAIAQAVAIGLLKKTEQRSYCAVSLPNILTLGSAYGSAHTRKQPMIYDHSKPHNSYLADEHRGELIAMAGGYDAETMTNATMTEAGSDASPTFGPSWGPWAG
jgi:DNA-binding IclR family transcriptional regulator